MYVQNRKLLKYIFDNFTKIKDQAFECLQQYHTKVKIFGGYGPTAQVLTLRSY